MTDATPRPCPICGKPADARHKPFCSVRCADVDLNRWFTGAYAVPASDDEDADKPPPVREGARDGDI
jgi:endogenous inhibitor of DNA gyrase (YacG/DUF329 family)